MHVSFSMQTPNANKKQGETTKYAEETYEWRPRCKEPGGIKIKLGVKSNKEPNQVEREKDVTPGVEW